MTEGIDGYNVSRPIRVLGPHERTRFTPDAWGYLVGLSRSGILDPVEFEQVVDRVLTHFEGRIALPDLRVVLGDTPGDNGDSSSSVTTH